MFSFFSKGSANYSQLAHEFKFKSIDGESINLSNQSNQFKHPI